MAAINIDVPELFRLYNDFTIPTTELCRMLNISNGSLHRLRMRYGLPLRPAQPSNMRHDDPTPEEIEERAAEYVPKLMEIQGKGPYILVGWSLGGVLAYACAIGLRDAGCDVRFVGLIDTVRAGEEIPQTKEEIRARWDRYALFAQRTFNVEIPAIPYEELEVLDDDGQVRFVLDAVKAGGVNIPGGVIEHQRTSYLDNRAIDTAKIEPYDGHVTLYMADRYHDDAIMFEPRYGTRKPDGGWGEFVDDLEVVPIGGEHIQAIDEPYIAKVGAHMSAAINQIQGEAK